MAFHKRLTANQQSILTSLREVEGALTAYMLLERVGLTGPTQVYRALNKLISLGLAHRIESLNAYVYCAASDGSGPIAFAICDDCGHIDQIVDAPLVQRLHRMTARSSFELSRAVVEVHGRCATCCAALGSMVGRPARDVSMTHST